jgi:anaerobic magnesium-protoporphyrin IX monomethyl ester cyclase
MLADASPRAAAASGAAVRRGDRPNVVLVGFQDQGNLGMGYLGAVLVEHGYSVDMVDFRDGAPAILERVKAADPLLVGFSLIFQYYLPGFRELAQVLRQGGVTSHFTMGGHYPSLCHDEVLPAIAELDSVVRFEGEQTLVDLVDRLSKGEQWQDVPGVVYLRNGEVVEAEPRVLLRDLDDLPHPLRPQEPERVCGFNALPILASRGCARRCSFCSIHTFYRTAPGKVVRVREPARIVTEMCLLHEERGVTIFLFQDDDFPLWGKAGRRWVTALVEELHASGLVGNAIWKISCRAEYVEPGLFGMLRDAGMYLVYMGLESGTEAGLEILNKQITVEENRAAIETLKSLGVMFEYGFMLFDPASTFDSIRENARFLHSIVADGSAAATFCRMLPYGGTPIRDRLEAEGRLRGDVTRPDYDFLDPRLNDYHRLLDAAVTGWIHGDGVSHQLNWAWHELEVLERLVGSLEGAAGYRAALATLTRASNDELFGFVEETAVAFERGDGSLLTSERSGRFCESVAAQLLEIRDEFVARNEHAMLAAVYGDRVTGPIVSPQIF